VERGRCRGIPSPADDNVAGEFPSRRVVLVGRIRTRPQFVGKRVAGSICKSKKPSCLPWGFRETNSRFVVPDWFPEVELVAGNVRCKTFQGFGRGVPVESAAGRNVQTSNNKLDAVAPKDEWCTGTEESMANATLDVSNLPFCLVLVLLVRGRLRSFGSVFS
jgi:hypothetical protein